MPYVLVIRVPAALLLAAQISCANAVASGSDMMRRESRGQAQHAKPGKTDSMIQNAQATNSQPSAPGPPGSPGPAGEPGLVIIGQHGPPGDYGPPGTTGSQGNKGREGRPGLSVIGRGGPQGDHGTPGPRGVEGQPGVQGYIGPRGAPGDQPVHAEDWESVLDAYESKLSGMEAAGGEDKHNMAKDIGLMYQQVALYAARSTLLKNSSADLKDFLVHSKDSVDSSFQVADGLHDAALLMGTEEDRKDLEEAQRLMPVMLGEDRAIHKMNAIDRKNEGKTPKYENPDEFGAPSGPAEHTYEEAQAKRLKNAGMRLHPVNGRLAWGLGLILAWFIATGA